MKNAIFVCLLSVLAFAGCSHKKLTYQNENAVIENEKGGLSARTIWLKNKKDSIDVLFLLRNQYNETIVLKESAFIVEFGGEKFPARQGTGELVLRAGLTYEKLLIFKMHKHKAMEGTAHFHIEPITTESGKVLPPLKVSLGVTP